MRLSTTLLIYAAILFVSFVAGRRKANSLALANDSLARIHSMPMYHGYFVVLWGAIPALLVMVLYLALGDTFVVSQVLASLPDELRSLPEDRLKLILNDIRNMAADNIVSSNANPAVVGAAEGMVHLREQLSLALGLTVIFVAAAGCWGAWKSLSVDRRARNWVESAVIAGLLLAASVAVLTTVGIVFSVMIEAI